MSTKPIYPDITLVLDISGPDGNAFAILGNVNRKMKRAGIDKESINKFNAEATSGDYSHLLATCRKWINFKTGRTVILCNDDEEEEEE